MTDHHNATIVEFPEVWLELQEVAGDMGPFAAEIRRGPDGA